MLYSKLMITKECGDSFERAPPHLGPRMVLISIFFHMMLEGDEVRDREEEWRGEERGREGGSR